MNAISYWAMIKLLLNITVNSIQYILLAIFLYYLIISAFGWIKRRESPASGFAPVNRFAILVAAHNEEAVIGSIIRNLKQLSYPKNLYDIFVIADNCDDNTATIAIQNGAKVYERFDRVKRGKGYSLEWMFKKLFEMKTKYDAVCILDADNLVSPNFLMEMNKHLCMGHKVVQGYLDSKNPSDTWISGNNSIAFWIGNRMFQLPRYYLGLSCVLGGTGLIVATDVLKEIGWGATCLTEDLEFTLKLVLKGMKVYWAHEAMVYDEKPLKLPQSWRQRKRWMQGHFDCMRRFLKALIVKAVKERNVVAFDSVLYMFQPIMVFISGIEIIQGVTGMITNFLTKPITLKTVGLSLLMIALIYLPVMFVIIEDKVKNRKNIVKYLLLLPIYNLTWVPIILQGFINVNKREWVHTLHTRSLDITDIEGLEKVG